ncbi:inactive glucose-1-phosphate adenylyltransferase small subunit 2, chloroplastic [Phoenix dactylifera]|uniref:Inactive glucose-1-phosphate adenylyltransferase small subunit 2, chloroplastic n=1 Tax=Phoenix dactylifera TaxID=42345 RepID=A0A8B9B0D8_PHODC|nr:inactive glucose-1-phosphate adenylyltransferase small subunit 2, chloroplastic [Phoenix dactylifera]
MEGVKKLHIVREIWLQSVLAIILDDGSETKLYPLTKRISKGAIPIAANYRLIDIVVSNCINSNIIRIYALTQFNSTSLYSHLSRAYSNIGLGKDGFIEILTACQSPEEQGWFKGNADAVRRWLWVLKDHPVEEFLVLSSHHIYEMDYAKLIKGHRDSRADITVAVSCNRRNNNPSYDFLIQNHRKKFLEVKHAPDMDEDKFAAVIAKIDNLVPISYTIRIFMHGMQIGISTKEEVCGARSMGIFVIKRDMMIKLLEKVLPKANDFRSEVIQGAISMGLKVHAYMFDGQWEDIETIEAFYHANIESARRTSHGFNFHDRNSPIYTMPHCLPPTVVTNALIRGSIIGDGCILRRCKITDSVIGMRTYIGEEAVIEDSVIMGSDFYQTDVQWSWTKLQGFNVPVGIGEQTHIRRAIIDKNARIGRNVRIVNTHGVQECDREAHGYIISGGIVVVLSNAVIPDGSML